MFKIAGEEFLRSAGENVYMAEHGLTFSRDASEHFSSFVYESTFWIGIKNFLG